MDSQRLQNLSRDAPIPIPLAANVSLKATFTPSAFASSSLMSCNRSTRTAVISSVMREAHRGMWMEGRQRFGAGANS
jgi:hypothetical protein